MPRNQRSDEAERIELLIARAMELQEEIELDSDVHRTIDAIIRRMASLTRDEAMLNQLHQLMALNRNATYTSGRQKSRALFIINSILDYLRQRRRTL